MLFQPLLKSTGRSSSTKAYFHTLWSSITVRFGFPFLPLVMEVGETLRDSSAAGVFSGWSVFGKPADRRSRCGNNNVTSCLFACTPCRKPRGCQGSRCQFEGHILLSTGAVCCRSLWGQCWEPGPWAPSVSVAQTQSRRAGRNCGATVPISPLGR